MYYVLVILLTITVRCFLCGKSVVSLLVYNIKKIDKYPCYIPLCYLKFMDKEFRYSRYITTGRPPITRDGTKWIHVELGGLRNACRRPSSATFLAVTTLHGGTVGCWVTGKVTADPKQIWALFRKYLTRVIF